MGQWGYWDSHANVLKNIELYFYKWLSWSILCHAYFNTIEKKTTQTLSVPKPGHNE